MSVQPSDFKVLYGMARGSNSHTVTS